MWLTGGKLLRSKAEDTFLLFYIPLVVGKFYSAGHEKNE
jgi:hypothetical protein